MSQASKDHVLDIGPLALKGQKGSDGSTAKTRCQKYVLVRGMSGENIDYGKKEPKLIVISLLINDGVPSRH